MAQVRCTIAAIPQLAKAVPVPEVEDSAEGCRSACYRATVPSADGRRSTTSKPRMAKLDMYKAICGARPSVGLNCFYTTVSRDASAW